jgi:Zn-dependent peptidase ImmA (M78 family)
MYPALGSGGWSPYSSFDRWADSFIQVIRLEPSFARISYNGVKMTARQRKALPMTLGPEPSYLSKSQIEKIASQVARNMRYSPASDLSHLVEEFGGRVSIKDFWQLDGTSDESIIVKSATDFEIFVPPHTSPERDRFTIAHELGHYVLHYVLASDRLHAKRPFAASRYGNHRVEWEANWFAASLLMPAEKFRSKFTKERGHIGRVAEQFNVSTAAAYVRAKALGLENDGAADKI